MLITRLTSKSSCTTFDSCALSSRTLAHARIPYIGIPNCDSIIKYVTTEVAKDTFPVPSGNRIRDTYGKVISGKMMLERDSSTFIIKFILIDFSFCIIFPFTSEQSTQNKILQPCPYSKCLNAITLHWRSHSIRNYLNKAGHTHKSKPNGFQIFFHFKQ